MNFYFQIRPNYGISKNWFSRYVLHMLCYGVVVVMSPVLVVINHGVAGLRGTDSSVQQVMLFLGAPWMAETRKVRMARTVTINRFILGDIFLVGKITLLGLEYRILVPM